MRTTSGLSGIFVPSAGKYEVVFLDNKIKGKWEFDSTEEQRGVKMPFLERSFRGRYP